MLGVKVFSLLLLIAFVVLTGTLIFIKGFLLSRTVIEVKSECGVEFALRPDDHFHAGHGVEGCWMHGRFKRTIIIIIDALKYDFIHFDKSLSLSDDVPPYKNKMTSIHNLINKKPKHTRMYKFLADPPTTTMQRLKGLTTGSLPTFVDAGANFQSYEITEDNVIDQMVKQEKQIKFFGDDTWVNLFPKRFYKSFAFPSFDVKDLHTVDDGILKNIYPQMRRTDWDVIIAHFLGVDHCGHRYGPNHIAMAEKLTQMDRVIRNVTELMRDDTVLFVFGDHGMTRTGDHGGDSADELEAGLFVYSPAQLTSTPQAKDEEDTVAQTDFVPTLSLLLGLPIPFSNLGMVIPDLFSHCPWWDTTSNDIRRVYHRVKALRLNAQQIDMYLSTYQKVASDLPVHELRSLKQRIGQAERDVQGLVTAMISEGATSGALKQFLKLEDVYKSYMKDARDICEKVWAKFDLKMIVTGILTIGVGISLSIYFLFVWNDNEESLQTSAKFLIGATLLHLSYLAVHFFFFSDAVPPLMAFILAIVIIFATFVIIKNSFVGGETVSNPIFTLETVVSGVLLVMYCCVYFSNSFVVHEDMLSLFFLLTLVCFFGLKIMTSNANLQRKVNVKPDFGKHTKKSKSSPDILQMITQPTVITFFISLLCCFVLRLTSNFRACREEQHLCEDSVFLLPLSIVEGGAKNQRYVFSVICLVAMICAVRQWLKYYGNTNGISNNVMCISYCPPLAALCISLHWASQVLPESAVESLSQWQQVLMAQVVYFIIIIAIVSIILTPLLVYKLPMKTDQPMHLPHQTNFKHMIPTLYNQLKLRINENHSSDNDKPPMVYGLGSVYSASILALLSIVSLFLALLLNDGVSPSLLLASIALYLCLDLYAAAFHSWRKGPEEDVKGANWTGMIMLSLLSTVFFYATGHQATIPSIRFESAYTGFYGNFNSIILPGFLIWSNTFAGPIFFTLACPLLVFWPSLSSGLVGWMVKKTAAEQEQQAPWQGDFKLFNDGVKLRKSMFRVCCGIMTIAALRLLSAACAAALHRRHLMVWKIFAPRFVYEAAFFSTTAACSLLIFLFVLRVDNKLSVFVKSLPTKG